MNNTKWNELFRAFYENDGKRDKSLAVFYRTKERSGDISCWSNEWELFVLDALKRIHVPGEIQGNIVTVYGYRQDCDYI